MSTAIDIVTRALYTIGAHSEINPASPEMLAESVDYLADMLRDWSAIGIDIGATVPNSAGDPVGEDPASRHALILSLALRLAPMARVQMSPYLVEQQALSYEHLLGKFQTVEIADKTLNTSTADGGGNMRGPI